LLACCCTLADNLPWLCRLPQSLFSLYPVSSPTPVNKRAREKVRLRWFVVELDAYRPSPPPLPPWVI
jgi:hypothetical protein